jgi:hypothetical protein
LREVRPGWEPLLFGADQRVGDWASNWIDDPQNTAAFVEYCPVAGWHISFT